MPDTIESRERITAWLFQQSQSAMTSIVKPLTYQTPLTPVVLLVKNAGNSLRSNPQEQDFSLQEGTPHRSITAILDPQQAGSDPTLRVDKKAA
jgi:hypothetical protein